MNVQTNNLFLVMDEVANRDNSIKLTIRDISPATRDQRLLAPIDKNNSNKKSPATENKDNVDKEPKATKRKKHKNQQIKTTQIKNHQQ